MTVSAQLVLNGQSSDVKINVNDIPFSFINYGVGCSTGHNYLGFNGERYSIGYAGAGGILTQYKSAVARSYLIEIDARPMWSSYQSLANSTCRLCHGYSIESLGSRTFQLKKDGMTIKSWLIPWSVMIMEEEDLWDLIQSIV